MENEVRQRKPLPFSWRLEKKWCRNGVWGVFGLVSVAKEMGKTVNSHNKSREKLKKFFLKLSLKCKTRFFAIETSRQQVASASRQNTQSQNCEKISKCFSWLEGLPVKESRAEPQKSLCTPRDWTFHSRTSRQNQPARSRLYHATWMTCDWVAKIEQHCFWNFSVVVKTKYFPKTPITLKNLFVFESTKIEYVKTHFNKYNHTNEYDIHWT